MGHSSKNHLTGGKETANLGGGILELAQKFMALFRGQDKAYADFVMDDSREYLPTEKVKGAYVTIRRPVTEAIWERHLKGEHGFVNIPIRDSSDCYFGAIDIDCYPLDLAEVARKVTDFGFPLVLCRSKSGGAHGYVFFSEPIPAKVLVPKLKEFQNALNYGEAKKRETFPKQLQVIAERGDVGNGLNMPYFGGDNTDRYAIKLDGSRMSIEEFFAEAERLKQTISSFKKVRAVGNEMPDGPPCLQHLIRQGVGWGMQNDTMTALAIYLRKSQPADWKNLAHEYNEQYLQPPMPRQEVESVINSVNKKDYNYPCSKPGLSSFCDRPTCVKRRHGVAQTTETPVLSALTKYEANPPVWFVDVEGGGRMELTTEALQNQVLFQKRCMEVLHVMPPALDKASWMDTVTKLLEKVHVIEVSEDGTPQGQLMEFLELYCTSGAQGRSRDDLLTDRPYLEGGLHHFKLRSFQAFLKKKNFREMEGNRIVTTLRERGGKSHSTTVKGKHVNYWTFPEFTKQTESLDVPKFTPPEEIF